MDKIACFGDSLTFGLIGYSYIRFCMTHRKMINRGINGDTTLCMYQRLKRFINCSMHNETETYIIAIGTNDLLLPYLKTVSFLWHIQMVPRVWIKKCLQDGEVFQQAYEQCIKLIVEKGKQMVVVGLPYLELPAYPNSEVTKRNILIQELAEKYQVPYVSITDLQKFSCAENICCYSWKYKNLLRIVDAVVMLLFPFTKDQYSTLRKLKWTVDGVHFNSSIAGALGKEISKYL